MGAPSELAPAPAAAAMSACAAVGRSCGLDWLQGLGSACRSYMVDEQEPVRFVIWIERLCVAKKKSIFFTFTS